MTGTQKTSAGINEREVVITRMVRAPRERVWEAFTDPKQAGKWWGPKGFTVTTDIHEFRVGGRWEYTMHGPDGTDYLNKMVYKEISKYERIVYAHGGHEKGKEDAPFAGFEASWTFEARGDKTHIVGRMVFPTKDDREKVVKYYKAIDGGHQHLDCLIEFLGAKPVFEIALDRLIDAPREKVWAAWTEPDQLKQWFAPKPMQFVVKRLDLRTGGPFEMAMCGPDGKEFPIKGTYDLVIPQVVLASSGDFSKDPNGQVSRMLSFEEEDGRTRLRIRHIFFAVTPIIEQAIQGAQQGWAMTLDQLGEFLKKS